MGIARVNNNNQCEVLELLVAAGVRPTLIGRYWLHDLNLLEQQNLVTNKFMHCYNAGGPVYYIAKLPATDGFPEGFNDVIPSSLLHPSPQVTELTLPSRIEYHLKREGVSQTEVISDLL